MPITRGTDVPTAAEMAAMDAVLLRRIAAAAPWIAALMLALAATKPWSEPHVGATRIAMLAAGDAIAGAALLLAGWAARRGRILASTSDMLAATLLLVLLTDVALHAVVLGKGPETEAISYVLLIVGSAVFFVDGRWYAAAIAVALATWALTSALTVGAAGFAVVLGVHVATAATVSGILFALQRRTLVHAERLRVLAQRRATKAEGLARELGSRYRELEAFAYTASHDLRAPLRAVRVYADQLDEDLGAGLSPEHRELLSKIRREATRLGVLVEDLLTLSRIGTTGLSLAPVDLSALAQEVVASLRAAEPGRDVRIEVAPSLTTHGDASLLRVVLENLLGNAWKFTRPREGAQIEVGAEETPRGRAFFVRDNGIGFSPEMTASLFQPFRRLSDAARFEGTGVGLASVARIVAKHGGEVWAEGRPGAGAMFWFLLGHPDGSRPGPVRG